MDVKGKMRNQTVKRPFTVTITDEDGFVIDSQTVSAENAREALQLIYKFLR